MKRDHSFTNPPEYMNPTETMVASGRFKEVENDAGEDELLAVLGYKLRTSEMMEVANRLEILEQAMGTAQAQAGGLSQLASEKVLYNPAHMSTWLESIESMFSELHPTVEDPSFIGQPSYSDYDLKAIPGKAILSPPSPPPPPPPLPKSQQLDGIDTSSAATREAKRLKSSSYDSTTTTGGGDGGSVVGNDSIAGSSRPVVLVDDSQENGVRLVHTLMACAEAIQQENMALAEALVKQIGFFATSQIGSMRKVATYFAEALARRVYNICSNVPPFDDTLSDMLQMHFYETCPYLKFAHFTANQAILEAFSGKNRVHIIDFSMNEGMQWPALMHALARRPGGPPIFRLTGIGPPAPDNSDRLHDVGCKLAQFADTIQIKFEYRGFVASSLTDLEPGLLNLRPESEVVAVNSVFELHRLLSRQGAVDKVMGFIKAVNPVVVTVVEQEANHNSPVFLDRFNESLHYYSTMFDSLETCVDNEDKVMTEVYLGRQICNIVACEGLDRVERHESLSHWRTRFNSLGFTPVHLGSNAFIQARMLLDFYAGGEGYGIEENEGCLMLGWHNRPLITTSAWQLGKNSPTRH